MSWGAYEETRIVKIDADCFCLAVVTTITNVIDLEATTLHEAQLEAAALGYPVTTYTEKGINRPIPPRAS